MIEDITSFAAAVGGSIIILAVSVLGIQFVNNASRNMSTSNASVSDTIGKLLKRE